MQISNNIPSLTALRQPSRLSGGQDNQKLVFLYPVLCSSNLGKFTDLMRDFLSVEFLSQIKISNGLNITSKISRVGSIGIGDKSINPALEVRKSMNFSIPQISAPSNSVNDDYSNFKNQQKLNQFSEFFKKQIEINPKYRPYNPVVSTVMADDNYLIFPIIVGTKASQINIQFLFYILATSIALDLSLDSPGNFEYIKNYIQNIDLDKFNEIFSDTNKIKSHFKSGLYNRLPKTVRVDDQSLLSRSLFRLDDIQKNKFFKELLPFTKALKFSDWDAESNHIMSKTMNLSIDSVPIIQTATQKRHFEAAMNSFNSYVSETIVPILYGLETILGPTPAHINFHSIVQDFLTSISKDMDNTYVQTAEHIRLKLSELPPQVASDNNETPLTNRFVNVQTRFANTQFRIDDLKSFCQNNSELIDSVKRFIYSELLPNVKSFDASQSQSISQFCDAVLQLSSKFNPLANTIESWAINAIPGNINGPDTNIQHQFNLIHQKFHDCVLQFFEAGNQYSLFDRNINNNNFIQRYPNFAQIFCNIDLNNPPQDVTQCKQVFIQTILQFEQAIEDILYFYFIWNFMSYICGYINEVDIDIQIQKKDVLDFPNYTLILPIEIFKFLYAFYTSNRLKAWMKSAGRAPGDDPQLASSVNQSLASFTPTADTKKMIEILNDRLKIPNVIVIDQFKKELYYQFMYMSKPLKLRLDSLETYINNQKDILTTS